MKIIFKYNLNVVEGTEVSIAELEDKSGLQLTYGELTLDMKYNQVGNFSVPFHRIIAISKLMDQIKGT